MDPFVATLLRLSQSGPYSSEDSNLLIQDRQSIDWLHVSHSSCFGTSLDDHVVAKASGQVCCTEYKVTSTSLTVSAAISSEPIRGLVVAAQRISELMPAVSPSPSPTTPSPSPAPRIVPKVSYIPENNTQDAGSSSKQQIKSFGGFMSAARKFSFDRAKRGKQQSDEECDEEPRSKFAKTFSQSKKPTRKPQKGNSRYKIPTASLSLISRNYHLLDLVGSVMMTTMMSAKQTPTLQMLSAPHDRLILEEATKTTK